MLKKQTVLKIISVLAFSLGLASCVIGLFFNMILNMENSHFVSRYGPNGEAVYRNYDYLYDMAMILVRANDRHFSAFYKTLVIGFMVFGITCWFWARDLKKMPKNTGSNQHDLMED